MLSIHESKLEDEVLNENMDRAFVSDPNAEPYFGNLLVELRKTTKSLNDDLPQLKTELQELEVRYAAVDRKMAEPEHFNAQSNWQKDNDQRRRDREEFQSDINDRAEEINRKKGTLTKNYINKATLIIM